MASPAQAAPQGARPPQAAPGGASGGGKPAIVQIVSGLAQLAQMLGQVFPPGAEEAQGIQELVNKVQSKMAQTQSPQQPQAPPI